MSYGKENLDMDKDLLKIKNQVRKPVKKISHESEVEQIASQLRDLTEKVDEIRENLGEGKNSHTKLKKKKEIIYVLKSSDRINTSKLSEKVDLSRTRCSEYLNEMKKEGIVKSEKDGRTKYYRLDI